MCREYGFYGELRGIVVVDKDCFFVISYAAFVRR